MKILESFKARVFFLTTALVLITALSISIFQQIQAERHTVELELNNARSMLQLAATQIENQYDSYIFHRESLTRERKQNLQNIVEITSRMAESYQQQIINGQLDEATAQQRFLHRIRHFRYADGTGYIWVNTAESPNPRVIAHPAMPELEGQRMDSSDPLFNNALGRKENLFNAFVQACSEDGEGFVDYLWPKPTASGTAEIKAKLSYVKLFKPWNWIIGAGIYMDDIETDSQLRMEAIIKELKKAFSKVKISENSYLFLFDANFNILVHPDYEGKGPEGFQDPEHEKTILRQLVQIAGRPGEMLSYRWQKPGSDKKALFEKTACAFHFKPLDWYIVASVYTEELKSPLYRLRWKILLILTLLLSLSSILASMLADSLSRPLQELAAAAARIESEGIGAIELPRSEIKEISKLGRCLNSMVTSIKCAIEDRDQLLEEIKSEEEKHRTTLNSIADAVISTDTNGAIKGMNPAAEEITGWKLEEAINRDISEIYQVNPGSTLGRCKSAVQKAVQNTRHFRTSEDIILINKNGDEHHISEQASLIHDENGKLKGMVVVFRNITEEYLIHQKLKEAEWKFNALFENGPLGVAYHRMIYDENGNPFDYHFIDANRNYVNLTGVDPRGKTVREAFPGIENDPFDWIGNYGRVARTGKTFRFRQHLPLNNRWYDGLAFQYKPDHFVVAFFEITEQRKLEQQLQQAQKMDAVGQLAGGIAHDFNNVLGGIMGAAELLFMEAGDNPRQKKFLNIILDSSHRATDLIKKLLTFGRQKPLSTVPVDVHNAVHEAIALLECSIDKKVRIEQQLQAPHSIVNGDLSQLQTVFINLGINASHAMPDGGTLSFSSSCIQLDEIAAHAHELEPGLYIKIQVRDTGIGISPENISRIFEPFFTTKPSGKGTGLGLAVSFGIIRQHLGAISVYSEPGNGAVFNILLPLSNLQCHEEDKNEAIHRGKGTILVIDDEKIIRETAADILRHFGYEAVTAASASEGIEAFKADRQNIRLVLLDMIMPEMNGRECFERLKSICPDVKVVLASGFSKEEDIEMMQEKGLCGFIHKPYSLRELSHLLNRIFV